MRWLRLPPGAALRAALVVATPIVLACVAGAFLGGAVAVLGIALGVAGAVQAAVADVGWSVRGGVIAVVPVVAAAGAESGARPVTTGLLVAVAALAQWPVNIRAAGIATFWPALAALAASIGLTGGWWPFAGWVAVGAATCVALALVLRMGAPAVGVAPATAARHALVTAVAAGLATYVALRLEIGHGYWLVLTLVMVLRPVRGETWSNAVDRTVGTLVGVLLGVAAVLVLPLAASLVFLVVCLLFTVAWALAGNVRMQTVFNTPMVVLIGSAGLAGTSVGLGLERIVFTVTGAVLAVGLAFLLHRLDGSAAPA